MRSGGPSRVIKARFRFVGKRGGAGWAEVNVSDWEDDEGEDGTGGIEYDRVFGEFFVFVLERIGTFTVLFVNPSSKKNETPFELPRARFYDLPPTEMNICVFSKFSGSTKGHAAD